MQAKVKHIHSPDVYNLEDFAPSGPFCILIQIMVGPQGGNAEESFSVQVCNVEWITEKANVAHVFFAYDMLIVENYSYRLIESCILKRFESIHGNSWSEIALKLSKLAAWEFEGI